MQFVPVIIHSCQYKHQPFHQCLVRILSIIVFTKLREALAKRGSNTVRGLSLCFRCLDSYDGNRKVDREEFRVGMGEIGVNLTNAEADALMT